MKTKRVKVRFEQFTFDEREVLRRAVNCYLKRLSKECLSKPHDDRRYRLMNLLAYLNNEIVLCL